MATTIDPSISLNPVKDATVSQGYYSVSRGTLLSRDTYTDRDIVDNDSSPPRNEGIAAGFGSLGLLKNRRHRLRRWWNRFYLGEKHEPNNSSDTEGVSDTNDNAGTSAIATAGTTAALDGNDVNLNAKFDSKKPFSLEASNKPKLVERLNTDSGSDTQIENTDIEDSEDSLRWRYSNKFHTLKDWIHKTLRKTRNSSSIFQHGLVISDLYFHSERHMKAKFHTPADLTAKFRSKSNTLGATHGLEATDNEASASQDIPPCPATAYDSETDTDADQSSDAESEGEYRAQVMNVQMLDSLRTNPNQRSSVASFNHVGHMGDVSIKDEEEEMGDLHIRLKDIGLSPTNEFYRELYAICNI
ncbi:HDR170Cp [Eremothecium sinecaudum]|uniref:HDR170Cp n=1 Tax=Eremothecium sinecaudum TaxID=45286 RepID=A0A120K2A5_9SACH|nr:HDR170Cp [Eremothecium sinecaudum]AMD20912.1 HDR170Cp [Eremothecium sinecaudum]